MVRISSAYSYFNLSGQWWWGSVQHTVTSIYQDSDGEDLSISSAYSYFNLSGQWWWGSVQHTVTSIYQDSDDEDLSVSSAYSYISPIRMITGIFPSAQHTGNGNPDKHSPPDYITDAIRPISEILTQDSLLQKCLHSGSQNTTESFHNVIWQWCPKTTFVGRRRLQLAVDNATTVYNVGECGRFLQWWGMWVLSTMIGNVGAFYNGGECGRFLQLWRMWVLSCLWKTGYGCRQMDKTMFHGHWQKLWLRSTDSGNWCRMVYQTGSDTWGCSSGH